MNRLFKTLAVITLAIFSLTILWAATGTVTGTVTGSGGAVSGARVVVDSASSSSYVAVTTTDQNGSFSVSNAPIGGVRVRVYDKNGKLLVTGSGTLQLQGQVVTLALKCS